MEKHEDDGRNRFAARGAGSTPLPLSLPLFSGPFSMALAFNAFD